ncbi:MAG: DUF2809 domain-containing protein [Candidatus Bathyarchaeota archaeon]|jgi:hypothetical protein
MGIIPLTLTINRINKKRVWTLFSLFIIVPIGFYTKFYSGPAADWINNSLGGVFYEIFWCLVAFFFSQKRKPIHIASIVLLVTCILEFMQLWHPIFLEILRDYFIGSIVLGTSFSWSDFPYYFVGCGIGWFWMNCLNKF